MILWQLLHGSFFRCSLHLLAHGRLGAPMDGGVLLGLITARWAAGPEAPRPGRSAACTCPGEPAKSGRDSRISSGRRPFRAARGACRIPAAAPPGGNCSRRCPGFRIAWPAARSGTCNWHPGDPSPDGLPGSRWPRTSRLPSAWPGAERRRNPDTRWAPESGIAEPAS